jgi:uncharacterized protein YbjT (DUF2867 family)
MQSGPLVAVIGATGHQGCGVVHSLLGDGNFRVRACSLDITGAKFGDKVEAVKMDMTKKEDILKAFQGVDYVFAMTDSADPRSKNKEYQIGKQLVDCAKEQGIKFFVWSSACDAHNISNQKYKLPMLTDKHQVSQYLAQSGLGHASIFLRCSTTTGKKIGVHSMMATPWSSLFPSQKTHICKWWIPLTLAKQPVQFFVLLTATTDSKLPWLPKRNPSLTICRTLNPS